jgi:hypothetical protein
MNRFDLATTLKHYIVGFLAIFFVLWIVPRLWNRAEARIAAVLSRRGAEERRKLLERLPFETVTVSGHDAFATWERLRAEGRGYPVVLGDELDAAVIFAAHARDQHACTVETAKVLEKAQELRHPADLQALRRVRFAQVHETLKRQLKGRWSLREPEEDQPELGEWPETVEECASGLSVISELVSSEQDGQRSYNFQIKERVVVALLPVSHSYEVLGYLLYGNWNECPSAEYHVAAQRSWSERYGAEIVGLTPGTLDVRVTRKPETRDEALKLAREHYIYCNDVIDQDAGTLSNLAAQLMQREWWYFLWER